MKCEICGVTHRPDVLKCAIIIMNGSERIKTGRGDKTVYGLASLIHDVLNDSLTQRCNHCMSVFDGDLLKCPSCGRDDALMAPWEPTGEEVYL